MGGTANSDWLGQDALRDIRELKTRMTQHGQEVYDLSMLNPDLAPPRLMLDKLLEASLKPGNHRYAVSRGIRKLREAFAVKYREAFGAALDAETEVCAAMGTKDALLQLLVALVKPGERILLGRPTYPAYMSAIRLMRLRASFFTISADEDAMLLDIERGLAGDKIKIVLLNFPNNPTGLCVSEAFWIKLLDAAERNGVFVINDFVYGEMGLSQVKPVSLLRAAGFRQRGCEIYSLSKAYSVPGWRLGAVLGNAGVIARLARVKSHADYGIFLPLQIAASAGLLAGPDLAASIVGEYRVRLQALLAGLLRAGWPAVMPQAGASLWVEIPEKLCRRSGGSFSAAKLLLERQGILALPGAVFGKGYDSHLRFALVLPVEGIREVARRISACD